MRKKNHRSKYPFLAGIALAVVTIVFLIFLVSCIRAFDDTLREENRAHLAEIANHIVVYTHSSVRNTQDILLTAAGAMRDMPEEKRIAWLNELGERQGFSYMGYVGKDGILHATEPGQNRDVSGEEYFRQGMAGEATVTGLVRRILTNRVVSGVLIAVPMTGEDGRTDGVLAAILETARLSEALRIESFKGEGYSYIIDSKGELVLHNRSMDYNNFFRVLNNVRIKEGGSVKEISEKVADGGSGMIEYDQLGVIQYAYYCPLGLNDWSVVNIVSKQAVTAETGRLTRQLIIAGTVVMVIFLILLVSAALSFISSQNQRHKAEIRTAFLANMSHEIRTPINAVIGISEILLQRELPSAEENYVRCIQNAGKGLLTFVNDFLELSENEPDEIQIFEETYQMIPLLHDLTVNTVLRIGNRPITFLTDVDATVPSILTGDRLHVRQILIHLAANAVSNIQDGTVCLSLWAEKEKENRVRLFFRAESGGEENWREDKEQAAADSGKEEARDEEKKAGDSLSMIRSLCRMMDGEVDVCDEPGKGTVFKGSLLQRAAEEETESVLTTEFAPGQSLLILEEDSKLREYFTACLERTSLNFRICEDAASFDGELKKGTYEYALARQMGPGELAAAEENGWTAVGTLLGQREYSRQPDGEKRLSIYVPLFGLQLSRLKKKSDAGNESPAAGRPFSHGRILLVDDNSLNLEIAESLLEPFGLRIDCVSSGREALEAVKRSSYDMIFLDYMMPEMDGVETLKAIRSLPGERRHRIPVVALTANATLEAQKMYREAGFDEFLAKPIDIKEVRRILEKWIHQGNE